MPTSSSSSAPQLYDIFKGRLPHGGKRVAVFSECAGNLQARAALAGAPLSVFIREAGNGELSFRVFTPSKERGESDSASIAACQWYQDQGAVTDALQLECGGKKLTAQLCGNEWLLDQGVIQVSSAPLPDFAGALSAHTAQTGRPNLLLELASLAALDEFRPDSDAICELNRQTATTGLILYTFDKPSEGPQRLADVSFRCFGPLKGFLEDAASSNMFACLTGVMLERRKVPDGEIVIRGAQRSPACPSTLSAQFSLLGAPIWVGGEATPGSGPQLSTLHLSFR